MKNYYKNEKESLNDRAKANFALKCAKNGVRKITHDPKYAGIFAGSLVAVGVAFSAWAHFSPDVTAGIIRTCGVIALPLTACIVPCVVGTVPGSKEFYNNLVRAGFVNSANEAPMLESSETNEDGVMTLTFESTGISLPEWKDAIPKLEAALNLTVAGIKKGRNNKEFVMYAVEPGEAFGVVYWDDKYLDRDNDAVFNIGETGANQIVHFDLDKEPMVLIGGSTGSGKSRLAILMMAQALLRGSLVTVIDLKGGLDYHGLQKMDAYICTTIEGARECLREAVNTLNGRKKDFADVGARNIGEYRHPKDGPSREAKRIIILIDEMAMMTDSGTSKEAKALSAECVDLISTIARMGRAFGIHLVLSTQRPDASAVPGSIKSVIDRKICGKADSTLSQIILDDTCANELIPKDSQGRFVTKVDGENTVFQAFLYDD